MTNDKLNLTAISPSDLATLFSRSLRRPVTEQQVRDIAEAGNILSDTDTINLIVLLCQLGLTRFKLFAINAFRRKKGVNFSMESDYGKTLYD